jgi:hypothetical protein
MYLYRDFSISFSCDVRLRAAEVIIDLAFSSHAMQCGCLQLESLSALGTQLTDA